MRSRSVVIALFLLVFVAAVSAQSRRVVPTPTPTPEESERISTEEIKLNVLAFDENGKFFKGVKDGDLVITENDVLHQPLTVRRLPANVLIVLDTGGEMRAVKSLDRTRNTARAIVSALAPDDSVAIMQYSDKPEIVGEWTSDKSQSLASINRTKFGRSSAFVAALDMARDFLLKNPLENRHLVLITDGTDSNANDAKKRVALNALLTTDISVHVLSYTKLESTDIAPRTKMISNSPPPKAMPDEVAAQLPNGVRDVATTPKSKTINLDRKLLKTLKNRKADLESSEIQLAKVASDTNGEFILPELVDEMVDKAPLVAKMIDSSYVVTYIPKVPLATGDGPKERNILVSSKRPGLVVEARRKIMVAQ